MLLGPASVCLFPVLGSLKIYRLEVLKKLGLFDGQGELCRAAFIPLRAEHSSRIRDKTKYEMEIRFGIGIVNRELGSGEREMMNDE